MIDFLRKTWFNTILIAVCFLLLIAVAMVLAFETKASEALDICGCGKDADNFRE